MRTLAYGTGDWDADTLGNHRVVIRVDETHGPAVRVEIPWRRRDQHPEKKALILIDRASGSHVTDLVCRHINREMANLAFQPVSDHADYELYFMPYTGTVQAPYPQITYLEPDQARASAWITHYQSMEETDYLLLPQAEAVEIQSIDELSSFYPMEVIATRAETESLLRAHPHEPFLLFPEDRAYPIRMPDDLPYRWIELGPNQLFHATAARGEYYPFQAGVFAARSDISRLNAVCSDLRNSAGQIVIPAAAVGCINLGGLDWTGKAFHKELSVPQGRIQPLWFGIQIPEDAAPGDCSGEISVQAEGVETQKFPITLHIEAQQIADHGDNQPERLSRLRWLDSTIALDDEVVAPFIPITVNESVFAILGRTIEIGADGFPRRIQSYFTPEMTGLREEGCDILSRKVSLNIADLNGQPLPWQCENEAKVTRQASGLVEWQASARAGAVVLELKAGLEFDGNLEYTLLLRAEEQIQLADVRLEVPFRSRAARYMLGLGFRGGLRPPSYIWKWDVAHKNQDSLWLGDVNAGLQVTLKDECYSRPLNTNFYTLKPLASPISWDHAGQGTISFAEQDAETILVQCSSGARTMQAGESLYFNFRLAITPFKPIDTDAQWSTRYFHRYLPADEIVPSGANTINVHHANEINPFINYPFLRPEAMKAYIDQAHALEMKVKIYYTVRELTNHAPELFALRSLGDEVLSDGPGGGHSWLQEHLVSNYVTGWHVYGLKDVAVVNSGTSRWHNFYLEGLNWLARNIGIDGLYIDDLAFDRIVMKRVRKILDRQRPGALIDLHSANQFRERDGYANSANLYMEHFPYLNRIWFGEYFDYNLPPDFWLVEVSGIPFGLMGEMLQDGGNPWRGMLYGMTGRLPWSGNPRAMWQAWDELGIHNSRMIGYWSPNCPVRTNHQDVLATVYQKENSALISIASWASEPVAIALRIDWDALGLDPGKAVLTAAAIQDFQEAGIFNPTAEIMVEPGKGWLLKLGYPAA
jgi:hypothetical protein